MKKSSKMIPFSLKDDISYNGNFVLIASTPNWKQINKWLR